MRTINDVINALTRAYQERNPNQSMQFVEKWFSSQAVVIGTSFNELFVGKDAITELLESDWNYWYNLTIHQLPNQTIETLSGTYVRLNASLHMTFKDSLERDQRYFSSVKDIVSSSLTPTQKAHHITWMLSHFLMHQSDSMREYERNLAIDLWIIEESGELRIKLAHFYSPENEIPDIVLDEEEYRSEIQRYQFMNLPSIVCEDNLISKLTPGKECIEGTIHALWDGQQKVIIGLLKEQVNKTLDEQILDRFYKSNAIKSIHELYRFNLDLQWILRSTHSNSSYRLKRFVAFESKEGFLITESYPYYYILEEKDYQDLPISKTN